MGECFVSSFSISRHAGLGINLQSERSSQDFFTLKDAKLNLRGDKTSNSQEEKMLVGGSFDVNLTDPLKQILKQTMLNQEVIFRKQVHELHRLYRMQKTMMGDPSWKDFHGYNFHRTNAQSFIGTSIDTIRNELWEERTFSIDPKVCSAESTNNYYLEEHRGIHSRIHQSAADLQLRPNHYPNHGWASPKEPSLLNQDFRGYNLSPPEEVKLSLSVGGNSWRKTSGSRICNDKITELSSQNIIDLEESTEKLSNEDEKPMYALHYGAQINNSMDNKNSHVSIQPSRSFTNDSSQGIRTSCSSVDGGKRCQEPNSFNQGFKECHEDMCTNKFTKRKSLTLLDLNIAEVDDSSFHSNDACSSKASSSCVFDGLVDKSHKGSSPTETRWRKLDINVYNESSAVIRSNGNVDPTLIDSNSDSTGAKFWDTRATLEEISQSKGCPIDLESIPRLPSDLCEELGSQTKNSENGNCHLVELKGKKVEEDTVFLRPCGSENTVQDGHDNKSPSSCKFDCVVDDNSNSAKTMQSGTYLGESNTQSFQVAETSSDEQNPRSLDSTESKHECFYKKKEESAEVDALIRIAAESLIQISWESPTSNLDCLTNTGSGKNCKIENKQKREHPQVSSDSFESIVLKLRESNMDDYCVSSKPLEIDETGKNGIKLKRGRRMKDFQRDILPGLASLSRHEIREDINIIEGVLRSREYKRMRSKMGDGANWSSPVRGRRSRLSYVGRRYYS